MKNPIIKKAIEISKKSLKKCYTNKGIYAGRKHFDDYWARDSFYASWGALLIDDIETVKKNLELFFSDLKYSGQLPLRIGTNSFGQVLKFFGIKILKKEVANYFQDKKGSFPQDQNSLFLITFQKYIEKTDDIEFLKEKFDLLKLVYKWNEEQTEQGMIYGKKYATWQDAIKKEGFTLYNNVLYYASLKAMDYLAEKAKRNNFYGEKAKEVKEFINERFWKKDHYIDWVDKKENDYFSTDGNTLAIIFGLADKTQSKKICNKLLKTNILNPFGAKTNYPKYKATETFLPYYLFNMQDYQNNGMHWLWLGALCAIALNQTGMKTEAKKTVTGIAKIISKHNLVYEVYNEKGNPIKRLFYRSEGPFAWSSSFFIWATNEIQ